VEAGPKPGRLVNEGLTIRCRQGIIDGMADEARALPLPTLNALIQQVEALHPDTDPITHLADAVVTANELTEHADHLVGHFVDAARAAGASWAQIGEGLGVSKQAVQQRFVPREPGTMADFEHSFTLPSKGRFHRYTDRAKHCVTAAEEIARSAANSEVGPVHLLVGLFVEPEALAYRALEDLGTASPEGIRQAAVAALPPAGPDVQGPIPFRTEGKKILDLAVREALRLGHNYVGTEHLLLALLVETDSPTSTLLGGFDVTYGRFTGEFDRLMREHLARQKE
jgi:hypothetical protein